jgi:hypothetical protein
MVLLTSTTAFWPERKQPYLNLVRRNSFFYQIGNWKNNNYFYGRVLLKQQELEKQEREKQEREQKEFEQQQREKQQRTVQVDVSQGIPPPLQQQQLRAPPTTQFAGSFCGVCNKFHTLLQPPCPLQGRPVKCKSCNKEDCKYFKWGNCPQCRECHQFGHVLWDCPVRMVRICEERDERYRRRRQREEQQQHHQQQVSQVLRILPPLQQQQLRAPPPTQFAGRWCEVCNKVHQWLQPPCSLMAPPLLQQQQQSLQPLTFNFERHYITPVGHSNTNNIVEDKHMQLQHQQQQQFFRSPPQQQQVLPVPACLLYPPPMKVQNGVHVARPEKLLEQSMRNPPPFIVRPPIGRPVLPTTPPVIIPVGHVARNVNQNIIRNGVIKN